MAGANRKQQKRPQRPLRGARGARGARVRAGRAEAFADRAMSAVAVVALTLIPLAYRMVRLDYVAPKITNTTAVDTGAVYDTFTHVKMIILYAAVAAMLGLFLYKLLASAHVLRATPFDAALALMCLFLMVSFFASEYKSIALNGFIYMLDGTLEHVCYCLLFFFGFHVLSKAGPHGRYFVPLYAAGIANALISALNFFGVNMIDTPVIKFFLGIPAGARAADAAAFTSTFGNINYLSGFGGVLFSIFLAKLLFAGEPPRRAAGAEAASAGAASVGRASAGAVAAGAVSAGAAAAGAPAGGAPSAGRGKWRWKARGAMSPQAKWVASQARALAMVAAMFSIVVTSLSSSGFLTALVMAPVIVLAALVWGFTPRRLACAAAALAACALVFAPLAAFNPQVREETFGMFKAFSLSAQAAAGRQEAPAGVAGATGAAGVVAAEGGLPDSGVALGGGDHLGGAEPASAAPSGALQPDLASLPSAPIRAPIQLIAPAHAPAPTPAPRQWAALSAGTLGPVRPLDPRPLPLPLTATLSIPPVRPLPPALPFPRALMPAPGRPAYGPSLLPLSAALPSVSLPVFPEPGVAPGSGRLYIWRETLRLVARRPLAGYGMDTITFAFPQEDIGKVAGLGQYSIYVTKPHNAYLSYAYGAGIPALLAFLALSALGAASAAKYFAGLRKSIRQAGGPPAARADLAAARVAARAAACFFAGWLAYLVQGLVNDDLISTAPIWWALFGIACGIARSAPPEEGRSAEGSARGNG